MSEGNYNRGKLVYDKLFSKFKVINHNMGLTEEEKNLNKRKIIINHTNQDDIVNLQKYLNKEGFKSKTAFFNKFNFNKNWYVVPLSDYLFYKIFLYYFSGSKNSNIQDYIIEYFKKFNNSTRNNSQKTFFFNKMFNGIIEINFKNTESFLLNNNDITNINNYFINFILIDYFMMMIYFFCFCFCFCFFNIVC